MYAQSLIHYCQFMIYLFIFWKFFSPRRKVFGQCRQFFNRNIEFFEQCKCSADPNGNQQWRQLIIPTSSVSEVGDVKNKELAGHWRKTKHIDLNNLPIRRSTWTKKQQHFWFVAEKVPLYIHRIHCIKKWWILMTIEPTEFHLKSLDETRYTVLYFPGWVRFPLTCKWRVHFPNNTQNISIVHRCKQVIAVLAVEFRLQ